MKKKEINMDWKWSKRISLQQLRRLHFKSVWLLKCIIIKINSVNSKCEQTAWKFYNFDFQHLMYAMLLNILI